MDFIPDEFIPDEFKCPITLRLMDDPVLCEDAIEIFKKEWTLISKYNKTNPSFEYGVQNQHCINNITFYHFNPPTSIVRTNLPPAPNKHKFVFDGELLKLIKYDNTFLINYKKLVKEYMWINKYINGTNSFLEFVFDEIIPNIDIIIDKIDMELKQQKRNLEQMLDNPCRSMTGGVDDRWMQFQVRPKYGWISDIEIILSSYTHLKSIIPELKSKEYYIVNQSEFVLKPLTDFGHGINLESGNQQIFNDIKLDWIKKKIEMMNLFVSTLDSIVVNQSRFLFNLPSNVTTTSHDINILKSYKEYVYWDTHVKTIHGSESQYVARETLKKDYTFNYFEPLMLLAKNIIDLTQEIKPIDLGDWHERFTLYSAEQLVSWFILGLLVSWFILGYLVMWFILGHC